MSARPAECDELPVLGALADERGVSCGWSIEVVARVALPAIFVWRGLPLPGSAAVVTG